MPPRWLCWLIGMSWLTTMGWLFWRDLWPSWRPGEPPPFHIDDVEEVHKGNSPKITWSVERGKAREGQLDKVFSASTWVDYDKDEDTYALHFKLDDTKVPAATIRLGAPIAPHPPDFYVGRVFKIEQMTSEYRVTRAGRLRSLEAVVTATLHWDRLVEDPFSKLHSLFRPRPVKRQESSSASKQVSLRIWGEVRDDRFFGHCRANAESLGKPIQFDLPPTAVSYTGSVLMPLHPVKQISGLHPGQRWRQPLVDPLRDAFASLPGFSGGVRYLNARVLPQPEMLKRGKGESSCLVIEYTDDEKEPMGRTWVEQSSNRVLQQEAILEDTRWIMKRELPRRPFQSILKR